jgi:hypothetical protein
LIEWTDIWGLIDCYLVVGLNPSKIIDVAHLRESTRRSVAAEGKYKTHEELEVAVDSRLWSLPELDVEKADGFGEIFPQVCIHMWCIVSVETCPCHYIPDLSCMY